MLHKSRIHLIRWLSTNYWFHLSLFLNRLPYWFRSCVNLSFFSILIFHLLLLCSDWVRNAPNCFCNLVLNTVFKAGFGVYVCRFGVFRFNCVGFKTCIDHIQVWGRIGQLGIIVVDRFHVLHKNVVPEIRLRLYILLTLWNLLRIRTFLY